MNLQTGVIVILFCVALGAVVVGQRLQVRSVGFDAGKLDKELRILEEERRVLQVELARKRDPSAMIERVRAAGLSLLPPEISDEQAAAAAAAKAKAEADAAKARTSRRSG